MEKRREYIKLKENQKIERDFLGYLEWMGRAGQYDGKFYYVNDNQFFICINKW